MNHPKCSLKIETIAPCEMAIAATISFNFNLLLANTIFMTSTGVATSLIPIPTAIPDVASSFHSQAQVLSRLAQLVAQCHILVVYEKYPTLPGSFETYWRLCRFSTLYTKELKRKRSSIWCYRVTENKHSLTPHQEK